MSVVATDLCSLCADQEHRLRKDNMVIYSYFIVFSNVVFLVCITPDKKFYYLLLMLIGDSDRHVKCTGHILWSIIWGKTV